ncbi:MAG: hypothetical protein NUW01_18385 [Gemmatimonadaceae bacterium]|nr:hypothetical protein [Gemmatimonadaceae bacterium]
MSAVTVDSRREARRATWRKSIKRRYHEYRTFCEQNGIKSRGNGAWTSHYARIRRLPGWVWRSPTHRYWIDRYSIEEIQELGGGLLLFAVDDVSSDAPAVAGRTPGRREQEVAA